MKVDHRVREDEMADLEIMPSVNMSLGKVQPDIDAEYDATLVHPATTLTLLKVEEAAFFLELAKGSQHHQAACLYSCNAFFAALISVPQIMEKESTRSSEFRTWFARKKARLQQSSFPAIKGLRNDATHQGATPPKVNLICDFREDISGNPTVSLAVEAEDFHGKAMPDPFAKFEAMLNDIRALVDEAHSRGFMKPPKKASGHSFGFRFHKQQEDGTWKPVDWRDIHILSKLNGLEFAIE